jgi:hypothetical protein
VLARLVLSCLFPSILSDGWVEMQYVVSRNILEGALDEQVIVYEIEKGAGLVCFSRGRVCSLGDKQTRLMGGRTD